MPTEVLRTVPPIAVTLPNILVNTFVCHARIFFLFFTLVAQWEFSHWKLESLFPWEASCNRFAPSSLNYFLTDWICSMCDLPPAVNLSFFTAIGYGIFTMHTHLGACRTQERGQVQTGPECMSASSVRYLQGSAYLPG